MRLGLSGLGLGKSALRQLSLHYRFHSERVQAQGFKILRFCGCWFGAGHARKPALPRRCGCRSASASPESQGFRVGATLEPLPFTL